MKRERGEKGREREGEIRGQEEREGKWETRHTHPSLLLAPLILIVDL